MSKDKCPDVFSRQMEATAFIVLHAFFASRAVLKIKENHLDIPQLFSHVTGLEQCHASEKN